MYIPPHKKEILNADLIPSISEELFKKQALVEKKIIFRQPQITAFKPTPVQKKDAPRRVMPAPIDYPVTQGEYGKITALIRDPAVTIIECNGPGTEIFIVRAGQRQITRISLTPVEINELIQKVAEKARIPLIEGVFKAAVDNFLFNAVFSSSIASRFLIKKQTPYSLIS
jgi:hypothetical protein